MNSSLPPRKVALCIGVWIIGTLLAAVSLVRTYHAPLNRVLFLSLMTVVVGTVITLLCKWWFDKA